MTLANTHTETRRKIYRERGGREVRETEKEKKKERARERKREVKKKATRENTKRRNKIRKAFLYMSILIKKGKKKQTHFSCSP